MSVQEGRVIRGPAAFLVLLLAGVLLAFHEVLGSAYGLFFRDHSFVFRPRWLAVRDSILRLELPALTTGGAGKIPMDHLLNGTYTPGTLILLLGPFDLVYDWFVIFHVLLLGVGAFLLARRLQADPVEALVVGAVCSLLGPFFSWENLVVALIGLAYVPWVLLAVERLVRAPSPTNVGLAALAIGFHLQAIIPPVAILDLLAGGLLLLHLRPRPTLRLAGSLLFAGALGFALAAVELLPALEAIAASERGSGFSYEVSSGWAVSPPTLVELLAPVFWAPVDYPFVNPSQVTGNVADPPYFTSLYFGTSIPLLLAGATTRRGRWIALAGAFFLVTAMGKHTPLHRLLIELPLFRSSRFAVKYTLIAGATVAVLAPLGIRAIRSRPELFQRVTLVHLCLAVGLVVTVFTEAFRVFLAVTLRFSAARWQLPEHLPEIVEIARTQAMQKAIFGSVGAVLLSGIAYVYAQRTEARPQLERLLSVVILLDLAAGATFAVSPVDLESVKLPQEVARVLEAEQEPVQYWTDPTAPVPPMSLKIAGGASSHLEMLLRVRAARGDLPTPIARRFEDLEIDDQSNRFHAAMYRLVDRGLQPPARERALARFGVRYVITSREGLEVPRRASWRTPNGTPYHLYEIPNVHRYVEGHYRWRSFDPAAWKAQDYVRFLQDEGNDGVTLVRGDLESRTSSIACASAEPAVDFTSTGPNGPIDARVRAECPALVVLQEVVTAGWRVTVDGREAEILEADAGYLTVRVPPGEHAVRFEYRSLVREWAGLSLWSLLAVGILVAMEQLRRRFR